MKFSKFVFLYLLFPISILTCLPLFGSEDFSLDGEVSLPSDILETIEQLKENPIDINSATYDELIQIPYITPLLAMRIEDYTKQNKLFNDTKDLLLIGGFNEPLLLKISPYITIKRRKISFEKGKIKWKTIWSKKSPAEEGYKGNPFKVSNKIQYRNSLITLGGSAYKDAYERSYFDFYTLYCYIQKDNHGIILGNYALDIGERLILGYPGFVFKSSGIVKGREYLIRPYTSGFEDFSFRGCAIKKEWKLLYSSLFVSDKKVDATIEDTVVKRIIYETGYHRSETEIEKKDRIQERLIGGIIGGGNERVRISTTSLFAKYDKTVEPDSSHYYRFSGKSYGLTGVHVVYNKSNLSLWSEYAFCHSTKGMGGILGVSCKPHNTTISMLFRNYGEKFYSPRAFSFCESEVRNEQGFYIYINSKLRNDFLISGYFDIFNRQHPTYFNPLSTKGYETFLSSEKRIMNSKLYVRYKRKEKNSYRWEGMSLRYERQNLRLSIDTDIDKRKKFRILWEGIIFYVPDLRLQEMGNLISLSFKSEIIKDALFESGIVFFETESYNSRIYLFINDIPGSMYTRSFFGKGFDFYVLIKGRVLDNLRVYGKVEMEKNDRIFNRIYKVGMEWR